MIEDTAFGELQFPEKLARSRKKAVLRALNWCLSIIETNSFWKVMEEKAVGRGKGISRKVGKKTLTVYPLIAAKMDAGYEDNHLGISLNHLPVLVNGRSVCVVPMHRSRTLLHTDMVASILQLFCVEKPTKSVLPRTLGRRLYPEDYPRPAVNRPGVYITGHLNEIFATLRRRSVLVADAADYALNELPHEDWVLLRDGFPWNEQPNLALHIAAALMTPERSERDWKWLLDMYQRYEPEEYTGFLLPNLFDHFHVGVVLRAMREHQFRSSDEAWNRLMPLLHHENEDIQMAAHNLLVSFSSLDQSLIEQSLTMMPDVSDFRDISRLEVYLAGWLSHKIDIKERLENIVKHLDPYRLASFLKSACFQGGWLLSYAETWIKQPFRDVHAALIECTSRISTVDHHKLWMPLMKNGRGTLQSLILENLNVMEEGQAYDFLDIGWMSHLRYIVRRTIETVEKLYPFYPKTQQMYMHGYEHSPSPRIRHRCYEKLVERYPESITLG